MPVAIVMAGGRSLRMRRSLDMRHKALVHVLGVSMLERNILMLLSHGIREIVVAISATERALLAFARGRAARLARAGGAILRVYVEKRQLGTIGAARAVPTHGKDLLIVNVDNLTSLDLTALLAHHRTTRAAMTIATHTEPFAIPFGQVAIRKGRVVAYREKPVLPVLLSSGAYVLSPAARRTIPRGRPVGAPQLVHILLGQQQRISAFSHSSEWIDVNDSASIERAESLMMATFPGFELWRQPPHREVVVLGILKNGRVALERPRRRRPRGDGKLPVEQVSSRLETPIHTAVRLRERIGLPVTDPRLVASFDELDFRTRQRTRRHLFACELRAGKSGRHTSSRDDVHWLRVNQLSKSHDNSRTIAYLKRYVTSPNSHSLGH